jgi:hypothetical protein
MRFCQVVSVSPRITATNSAGSSSSGGGGAGWPPLSTLELGPATMSATSLGLVPVRSATARITSTPSPPPNVALPPGMPIPRRSST